MSPFSMQYRETASNWMRKSAPVKFSKRMPALEQIRNKQYFECLDTWSGDILFVGVSYDADTKEHECKIERFVKD